MEGVSPEQRTAAFRTVIALVLSEKEVCFFEGRVDGRISTEKRGSEGFGYDPVFIPEGGDRTFAEMGEAEKNAISHRGRATKQLIDFLTGLQS